MRITTFLTVGIFSIAETLFLLPFSFFLPSEVKMLDNLDLDISIDKETYDAKIEVLMQQLRSLQLACRE
ncbi:MAG TPA: hypothetical protein DD001_04795, partial [Microcoleaceae bacterium UBA10368]|nr:hypothetical protein [Microcoleaceae cyanobacterium UBA10368]